LPQTDKAYWCDTFVLQGLAAPIPTLLVRKIAISELDRVNGKEKMKRSATTEGGKINSTISFQDNEILYHVFPELQTKVHGL
jgi:hypothetical protein